jgi:endogenous inhibitor of DNA gyrase (YacG/DUF329 family)
MRCCASWPEFRGDHPSGRGRGRRRSSLELKGVNWQCPICKEPTASETHPEFPFCSERCRTFDLSNWSSERYVVSEPVIDEPPPEQAEPDEAKN